LGIADEGSDALHAPQAFLQCPGRAALARRLFGLIFDAFGKTLDNGIELFGHQCFAGFHGGLLSPPRENATAQLSFRRLDGIGCLPGEKFTRPGVRRVGHPENSAEAAVRDAI
jgi:hypothetical protein